MTTPKTFMHRFYSWLPEVECKRWVNPDGSEGAIVALTATIAPGLVLHASVSVMPGASIGNGASIGESASFEKDDWLFVAGPQGSRLAWATVTNSVKEGLRWWVGCQHGLTTEALTERVKREHADAPDHLADYLYLIDVVEKHPGLARHRLKSTPPAP